jgi:hypothetical protein
VRNLYPEFRELLSLHSVNISLILQDSRIMAKLLKENKLSTSILNCYAKTSILNMHYHLLFNVSPKTFSLIWRRHRCRWMAAKFRPMLVVQGLRARRDLYRATPAVTLGLGFSGLIRRTAPFRHLLRQVQGCWAWILTIIFNIGNQRYSKCMCLVHFCHLK